MIQKTGDNTLTRGDVIVCALSGDYGKPRPALIVQSDLFNPTHVSVVICPITSHMIDASLFRVTVYPSTTNGVNMLSQIMVDKLTTIKTEKISRVIGHIEKHLMQEVDDALKLWLSL